ncbi:MAG: PTS-dependent dihydroxyacetone kinase phosphotransferase subunit DhaM [Geminicoccaceae bacterium]|nr:PTS-dependent dihydroxyacetone kinase phosphotransferase subunit DhaM [Geminicoccaceae bacterium]
MSVGIVIVSHSPLVAEGAHDMVRQMAGDQVQVAFTGGDPGGGLGTDPGRILEAIERVWSEDGVAVFVDMGAAEMNSEMAIEMLGEDRAARVRIVDAPVVEGAVFGGTAASGGASLEKVVQEARSRSDGEVVLQTIASSPSSSFDTIRREVTITHKVGLHARPAVAFTKLAKSFDADIRLRALPDGQSVDAGSIVKVMGLKLKTGAVIEIEAHGTDAREAVEAMAGLVARDFDEPAHDVKGND